MRVSASLDRGSAKKGSCHCRITHTACAGKNVFASFQYGTVDLRRPFRHRLLTVCVTVKAYSNALYVASDGGNTRWYVPCAEPLSITTDEYGHDTGSLTRLSVLCVAED